MRKILCRFAGGETYPAAQKPFGGMNGFFCLSRSYLTEITLPLIRFPLSGSFIFYRYRRIYPYIQDRTWAGGSDPPAPSRTYRSGKAVYPRAFWNRSSGRISPCSLCRRYRSSPRNPPAWESRTRGRIYPWPWRRTCTSRCLPAAAAPASSRRSSGRNCR